MNDLGVFLAATLALNLTPGPDMLYVITRSATEGRAAGGVSLQLTALGTLFNVSGTIVNILVALAPSGAVRWTQGPAAAWVNRASGLVFVGLGVRLAWKR